MAYDKSEIFERAKEIVKSDADIAFIEEIITEIGIAKPTFYEYFPVKSNEMNEIKDLLLKNRSNIKKTLRNKWKDSDNATLNVCLYKLLSTDEERELLSDKPKDDSKKPTIGDNLAKVLGQLTNG